MEMAVLIPILIFVGKKIFEVLFKWLEKKYGEDLMDLSYSNVSALEVKKNSGLIDSDEAERINVDRLGKATAMSPPIPRGMRKFINFVTYMVFMQKEKPIEFEEFMARLTKWEKKGKRIKTRTDFALENLYVDRPDVLKKKTP